MKLGNLKYLIIVLSAFLIGACGASKKSQPQAVKDLSSRGTPNPDGTPDDPKSIVEYYALCNSLSGPNLNGSVTVYVNPLTNQYEWEYIRMELKEVPTQLTELDSFYMQFFRWQESTPGQTYVNNAAVGIYFQYEDGSWLNEKPISNVSKNTIETLISDNNLKNVTLDNFFNKVVLVLSGMSLDYDVLMVNTYDAEAGSDALTSTNVLLPAFAADPNIYAETHSTTLQKLHPNYDIKDSGYNQWQFFQETQSLCGQ